MTPTYQALHLHQLVSCALRPAFQAQTLYLPTAARAWTGLLCQQSTFLAKARTTPRVQLPVDRAAKAWSASNMKARGRRGVSEQIYICMCVYRIHVCHVCINIFLMMYTYLNVRATVIVSQSVGPLHMVEFLLLSL